MVQQDHEYSVLGGLNRAKIGHTIGAIAAVISPLVVSLVLVMISILDYYGIGDRIPRVVMWPVSAGVIYAGLYWIFAKYAWKYRPLNRLLKVPDLAGEWHCDGQTINPDKTPSFKWEGTVVITQNWDKLRIRLKTAQSGSNSIAAALFHDEVDGFRILYNYKNDPRSDQPELQPHRGFADITFNPDLKYGEGEYFNGQGRFTFGAMKLTRKA